MSHEPDPTSCGALFIYFLFLFFDAVLLMSRGQGEHPENSNKPPPQVAEEEEDEIGVCVCVCVFWRLIPNKSVHTPILAFLVCGEVRSADDSGSFGEGGSGRLRTRGGVAVRRGLSPVI